MESAEKCFFPGCNNPEGPFITGKEQRIKNIISASISREDVIHIGLQEDLANNPNLTLQFHKSCVSSYTSKTHIARERKRLGTIDTHGADHKRRRSEFSSFDFRVHCLICGETCLSKDSKNPSRWRRVMQCRTREMKNELLTVCDERNDASAEQVHFRINGSLSDLHAADAQYHFDCFTQFTGERNIKYASNIATKSESSACDLAFQHVVNTLRGNASTVWNSIEIYSLYIDHMAATATSSSLADGMCAENLIQARERKERSQLVTRLEEHFGPDLVIMQVKGCASLICFKKYLPATLKLVEANDSDVVKDMCHKIQAEVQSTSLPKTTAYKLGDFTKDSAIHNCSETLLKLLSSLVSNGKVSKKSLALAQAIQALVSRRFNHTTLGLALQIHHRSGSKELVDILYSNGFCCSYDEVKRFRKSAALHACESKLQLQTLLDKDGLVSTWCDNFDLNIFTPNGMRETHSMAVEFVQSSQDTTVRPPLAIDIPRISKKAMKSINVGNKTAVKHYQFDGQKRPNPPNVALTCGIPYDLLCKTTANVHNAMERDLAWLVSIVQSTDDEEPIPEWSGAMTASSREDGRTVGMASHFVFGPLIDLPPAHTNTILTTLIFIEESLRQQRYIHLSADMQLYKIIMQVKWADPDRWKNLIARPGGMHTIMSFVGCIGTLMNGSGLEELLEAAFKGVASMLNGKAWPKALRGLRMVVVALLRPLISAETTVESLEEQLETICMSRTARLWVHCLIIPLLIVHLYVQAEREGDWLLHMYALKRMVPYFFSAGHWHYARYIVWHIKDMASSLPSELQDAFLRGEHVCRHRKGVWNAVFLDQFGEQTYIRYGKAKGGFVGKSLSAEQVAEWTLSHHICNAVSLAMDNMFDETEHEDQEDSTGRHKEEGKRRRQLDNEDRKKIILEVERHTNPLLTEVTEPLYNIINGRVAADEVNVDQSISIGGIMAAEFTSKLPDGFYDPLKKTVITMEAIKKKMNVGDSSVYDMEKLYARLLIVSQKRDVELSDLFEYELAPVPPALFDDYGDMRKGSKSVLVSKLAITYKEPPTTVDVQLIDGNEAIYHTLWPKNATMSMFAKGFISSFVRPYTTYVVFDCYQEHSIKSHERRRRAKGAAQRDYKLTDETVLPARDIIMKSDQNKKSFIEHLCTAENPNESVHIIGEECPYTHEEADVKLISYLLHLHQQTEHIQVLADDTDIFVLLVYFVWCYNSHAQVSMKKYNGKVIDINATVMALGDICQDLLPAHALSGCDSVSYPYGKGKASVCSMLLKSKVPLRAFADPDASEEDWTREGFQFLSYLYGGVVASTLDGLRYLLFSKKNDPPKIKSLPPTSEAALQHIKRARIQVLTWRAADQLHPPDLDVSQYGWELSKNLLCPVNGTSTAAPPSLMQFVACGCKSSMPCGSQKCSCRASGLSCTTYCKCGADEGCSNEHTKQESAPVMDGGENDEDDDEENAED